MLLVIDVGNTNTVLGVFAHKKLKESWRLHTSAQRTADEYGILLRELFASRDLDPAAVHDVIMASVVPPLSGVIEQMCQRYFGRRPMQVGPGLKTGTPILYENPREVGADRIVNAVAAYDKYQRAGIVVDFGTATTFDAIGTRGEYLGGVIAPGLGISAEALFQHAAKLPRVEVVQPERVIGRNTVHSIQAGLFYGYVGLVDGLVQRMMTELPPDPFVIATGGLGRLLAAESKTIQAVHEDLTLEGLLLLYERNAPRSP